MKKSFFPVVLAAACGVLAVGCVEQQPELTREQREAIRGLVSREAPSPQHEIDAAFDGRVRLIGYDVSTETVTPGQPFTVTWYWHAQRELGAGWQLFTHLADGRGENRINEDHNGPIRQNYQPARWRAGEYITDRQTITLPHDWNSDRLVIYVGIWNGPHRLAVTRGPNDGENRVRALSLPVAGGPSAAAEPARPGAAPAGPPRTPIPALVAPRASSVRVDGRLDEPAWERAASTAPFVNTVEGTPADLRAKARVLWDDRNLYVAFEVDDTFLRSTLTGRDAHLWEQDAVEIMIDPDGDGRNYYELQVAPTGEVFDTRYESRRAPPPFGHTDWNPPIQARVAPRGTVNDDDDDEGYTVEIALPWASFFGTDGAPMSAPPPGSAWRVNFYVLDAIRGGSQRSAGWSATHERDFHVPARFGRITFAAPEPTAQLPSDPAARRAALIEATPRVELPPPAAAALQRSLSATAPGADLVRRHTQLAAPPQ
jgi:hypothetical protein